MKKYLTVLFGLLLLLPLTASADIGPKPTLEMLIEYETSEPITIEKGYLLVCEDSACKNSRPLEELGPQYFECTQDECDSAAYGYGEYLQLKIKFSDKTRLSNVFTKDDYNGYYNVIVTDDALDVLPSENTSLNIKGGFFPGEGISFPDIFSHEYKLVLFLAALTATIVLELLAALIYLAITKKPMNILLFVFLANVITIPAVWWLFPLLGSFWWVIVLSETFAIIFEALFIWGLARKNMSLGNAFFLSIIINIASFGMELLVFLFYRAMINLF